MIAEELRENIQRPVKYPRAQEHSLEVIAKTLISILEIMEKQMEKQQENNNGQ